MGTGPWNVANSPLRLGDRHPDACCGNLKRMGNLLIPGNFKMLDKKRELERGSIYAGATSCEPRGGRRVEQCFSNESTQSASKGVLRLLHTIV